MLVRRTWCAVARGARCARARPCAMLAAGARFERAPLAGNSRLPYRWATPLLAGRAGFEPAPARFGDECAVATPPTFVRDRRSRACVLCGPLVWAVGFEPTLSAFRRRGVSRLHHAQSGWRCWARTSDLLLPRQARSHLRQSPVWGEGWDSNPRSAARLPVFETGAYSSRQPSLSGGG